MLAETWTTFPSRQEPPASYTPPTELIEATLATDGAGPAATVKNGSWLLWLKDRWGYPLYPAEPASRTIAILQRQSAEYTFRHRLWYSISERTGLPVASRMLTELEWLLDELYLLLEELDKTEIPTLYSMAKNPDQLEAMLQQPPPAGRIDYKELKARIDIVEFTSRYTRLKKNGKTYRGICPLHQEKTASFYVYPESRSFYCFGCQTGGDVITFARLIGVDRLG